MGTFGNILSGAISGGTTGATLGPIGAGVGALAGGALGGLESLFGGSSPQSTASNAILKNIPSQIATGNAATQKGLNSLYTAGNFYNTILGGNRDAITSLLNPQVSTVLGQYDNAAKTAAQFAPRGGGQASTLASLPFQKATALGQAYQGALPAAAQGATGVGQATAGVGTSLLGQGTSANASLLPFQTEANILSAKQYGEAGSGIGKILAQLLNKGGGGGGGGIFGGGGGSGSAGNSGGVDSGLLGASD